MDASRSLRSRALLLATILAATGLITPAAVTDAASAAECGTTATVVVDSTRFEPSEVRVCEGGTVTWQVQQDSHTIVADDGRFAFRDEGGGTLPVGAAPSFTVGDVGEFVGYHCEIHPSMRGRIVVGDGPPPPPGRVIRVPADEPSLHDAVIVADPGSTIAVAPGVYELDRTLVVDAEQVTIRGTGDSAGDVVLSGAARFLPVVVDLPGSHVTLANLTVAGGRSIGVHATGNAVGLVDVVVAAGPLSRDGIVLDGVTGAGLERVTVAAMGRAGVEVRDCPACGVAIRDLHVSDSLVGVHVRDAAGVVVDDLHATGNTTGVVAHGTTRPAVITMVGSDITDNCGGGQPADPDDVLLGSGAGILLAGVADSLVADTTVAGHDGYGIVLAAGPAVRTTITGNTTAGNSPADLAWDGLGAATCFASPGGGATSDPPTLLATAGCDSAAPTSPPYPPVTAHVLTSPADVETPDQSRAQRGERLVGTEGAAGEAVLAFGGRGGGAPR